MRFILFLIFLFFSAFNYALSLRSDAPERYVVQSGDTLWSISSHYLHNPWEWKKLWHVNPKIKNPKRLYPGAVLVLSYYKNKPYLRVLSNGTVKLSPNARPMPLEEAVPPVPLSEIKPFLNESLILDQDILSKAPYIVALIGEHMIGGQGDEAYVRGLHPSRDLPTGGIPAYSIFRGGKNYEHPITKELLGYRADLVGYAELVAGGEPATILLTNINEGVKVQDSVLINNSPEFKLYFEPKAPQFFVKGFIIDMPDGMPNGNVQEAAGGVVVISLGGRDGLEAGDVLGIYRDSGTVSDPKNKLYPIQLPPERIGEVMVFRVFTKASFALVVRSTRAVYLNNFVTNP
ncbi:LysM peptidoglycan-binding domain-containing protein [Fluoribacter dumoffii]|uniref:LysM peptidoglycan-binding domain-containing protein n=1 Tax=Fluoribacter dumoffii TaxID=463 RepID=UPI002243C558|nr:LysM domain-containing protein [Fluoribacter dumoffii]MCW8417731.1 LysM peptidoglycan-binding domain-containing protein [Fluoribacter dumoffii]MCW8454427.1 LysM peptidoglycan-binding domain-containing protein [Fluoribacter dumoffii]MCW8461499.1 LysM peptidoglycan-binding domain-containing protein [Fluoribacter dumoffii]MCW8484937.1 LysM peptidoglycan-binding domain-containing protein [Fluoribacter dumoffii]